MGKNNKVVKGSREGSIINTKTSFKDGSKPDFLDLDKDGDKTESMKSAAASAKTVKAKSGSRTGVRGTGAAKKGFRKARLS
jgi:hypothetical protein